MLLGLFARMDFKAVKPDEKGTVIFLGVLFALVVVWLTSYIFSAWKRGTIAAPTSRWLSSIKTFSRAEEPVSFWIIYFIHFAIDAVFTLGLLIIIYRLNL
jgi:hypothetical protein